MAKVLIFTSHGGGGHISASNAIIEYLKDEHQAYSVALFRDVLPPMDPFRIMTFNTMDCEEAYNFFLRRKWSRAINLLCLSGLWSIPFVKWKVKKLLIPFLQKEKPDLIISVIPIVNGVLNEVTRSMNIPFLVIPTDLDTSTFIHNVHSKINDKFFVGLPFNDPAIWKIADKACIYKKQIDVSGFPLRPSFFEQKNIEALKEEFHLPKNKPIIFLLMGAVGSEALYRYVLELKEIKTPFHLIVCLGRNEELRMRINEIALPPHVTLSLIGFTERIADLMAVSNLCITKAGSVSVAESIYMNKPTLLDCTSKSLMWEDFNIHFIKEHKFGSSLRKLKNLKSVVSDFLANPSEAKEIEKRLANFPKQNFSRTITDIVNNMLSQK
ncbi:MAG TPA: glycosyltransferase [Candidatus Babeliales bacterium]|nr:glycosyltransferase [Candidatus Babeliales bacterium]